MSMFIDRRTASKNKSAVNRQRFLRRYRAQIRDAVDESLKKRSITDVNQGEKVSIPGKDTNEPVFRLGKGGRRNYVLPGNKEFVEGDQIPRPQGSSGGGGSSTGNEGEWMDEFVFDLSRDEFLDFLFEGLELPNLQKKQVTDSSDQTKKVRSGYVQDGSPANISVIRSMRQASARRIAVSASRRRELRELEALLEELDESDDKYAETEERITDLRAQLARIPFLDDFDLRYRNHTDQPLPNSKAVMFCVMDVSGSMTQATKDLAKRFFILLYLFLERNYDKTDVVFIRHHTRASEVDEEEFFYSRETGGTVVSSALELMHQIIADRYPTNEWNIYGSQASDGDNWPADAERCVQGIERLLPQLQYYAYIEIGEEAPKPLWETYAPFAEKNSDTFAMQTISGVEDIYPVFRALFQKETA